MSKLVKTWNSLAYIAVFSCFFVQEICAGNLHHQIPLSSSVGDKNELFIPRDTRKSTLACPEREVGAGFACPKNCSDDSDCSLGKGERCICFRECGYSCVNKDKAFCTHPGFLEDGKVIEVGPTGFFELLNLKENVPTRGHILYECNPGYALVEGPLGRTCKDGEWDPPLDEGKPPRCEDTEAQSFHWFQPTGPRLKRRAIKTGGSSSIVRSKTGPGGHSGGLGTRRTKKKGSRYSEDDDFDQGILVCNNLDHDPYIEIEVIQVGDELNETFSAGAVVKVSCLPGFGVNLPNETVRCDKGKWRPKIPQCSALPCRAPYLQNGIFYEGVKPLYFQEMKKSKTIAEARCNKGYKLRGPSKLNCWYGEWDVDDAPECLPAPCKLPLIDAGSYLGNYDGVKHVQHGTEVDYVCSGSYRKLIPGPVRCDLGEWRPSPPYCVHPSNDGSKVVDVIDPNTGKKVGIRKNGVIQPMLKKTCGMPPRYTGAHVFYNQLPVELDKLFNVPDGADILYRCTTVKSKGKNRWKLTCDDGKWVGSSINSTCDTAAAIDRWMVLPNITMINGSCSYKKTDPHVVAFFGDQVVIDETETFPTGSVLTSRCVDIGKFRMDGAVRRKCLSAQWLGITPKCEGLSQYHDYALDKPPTILFRFHNGSIVQSKEGTLVVYPGTTLHMECLWLRRFGKPTWSTSIANKTYPEGWAEEEGRDSSLEYRLTIHNAQKEDEGTYSCKTPTRHPHEVKVVIKEASCSPLPDHPDLIYSTTDVILGTRVNFTCRDNNTLVGAPEIFCTDMGKWSAPLPRCENVRCVDISLVPAMAPMAPYSNNASLTKGNETAPPKVTVYGTYVGARAVFSCDQGFMISGPTEATCLATGAWSASLPTCKEVECPPPPIPDNAILIGGEAHGKWRAGNFAHFECRQGYMLEAGQGIIACQDNGRWSKSNGHKCKIGCPYPGSLVFGTLSEIKFYYNIGDTVQFECQPGFELNGAKKMSCLKTGKWSNLIPTCAPLNYDHVSNPYGIVEKKDKPKSV